jgi:hypothetical protein
MKPKGTPVYTRLHKRGLTLAQLNAIDLLATGKRDKETAELLHLSRTCVTKWRLYDPLFQAALNRRREEAWGAGIDRLRSLIPQALDVLAEEMQKPDSPNRFKAAVEILRLTQLPGGTAGIGPTDPDQIVRQVVKARREQAPSSLDDMCDDRDLPPFTRHLEQVRQELEVLASEPDEAAAGGGTESHEGA